MNYLPIEYHDCDNCLMKNEDCYCDWNSYEKYQ